MPELLKELFSSMKLLSQDPLDDLDLSKSDHQVFHVILIKPTRYDDDGYPIHWLRSAIPANALACVYSIAQDSASREVLGSDVEIRVAAYNESNAVISYPGLIERIKQAGHRLMLCLVGVQSNQFPRAVDISQPFLSAKIPVCIGGFHVSGTLAMLSKLPPELAEFQTQGASLFAGEAEEGRFDRVIQDAWENKLQPLYNYSGNLISLHNSPLPRLPESVSKRELMPLGTIDIGRGCPYKCSFCCIINVHGHMSRTRPVDVIEQYLRNLDKRGVNEVFITDDNFARNKEWRLYFDRIIELRKQGIKFRFVIQVDTLCHKIPGFIDKAVEAGVDQIFIGLENINPDNLVSANKPQNKITEYREMLLQWKRHPVVIWGAYIIGFPNDTRESILRDIEIIKRELPIDFLNASILTPLPGSADHKEMLEKGVWMDPDLNRYDLAHRVFHHQQMTDDDLDKTYEDVYHTFYTYEHMTTILKRMTALGSNKRYTTIERLLFFGLGAKIHPKIRSLEFGLLRKKPRLSRRANLPKEPTFIFYPKYIFETLRGLVTLEFYKQRLIRTMTKLRYNPESKSYTDIAITSPKQDELDTLGLYQDTRGAQKVVELAKQRKTASAR